MQSKVKSSPINFQNIIFIGILLLAFFFRVLIVSYALNFRENTDVLRYKDWARIGFLYGFTDTYKTDHLSFGTLPNNQPPGSLYILSLAYFGDLQTTKAILHITHTTAGTNTWINGPLVDIFFRIPSIVGDLLIGLFIYLISKQYVSRNKAILASIFFLFNPIVFYNSAFWGQMDAVNNVFAIIALYLLSKKKYTLSLVLFIFSLLIKFSLLPLFLFFMSGILLFSKSVKKTLLALSISILCYFILLLPVTTNPFMWFWQFAQSNSLGEMQNITAFAFNFWWVIFKPLILFTNTTNIFNFSEIRLLNSPLSHTFFKGIPLSFYSFGLFILFCLPFVYLFIIRNKFTIEIFSAVLALITLISFIFLPQMHERYMYPFFVFFPLFFVKKFYMITFYIILSILNWINLYIVWHPMKLFFMPYVIISNINFQWAIGIIILLTFITLYFLTIKICYENK